MNGKIEEDIVAFLTSHNDVSTPVIIRRIINILNEAEKTFPITVFNGFNWVNASKKDYDKWFKINFGKQQTKEKLNNGETHYGKR